MTAAVAGVEAKREQWEPGHQRRLRTRKEREPKSMDAYPA